MTTRSKPLVIFGAGTLARLALAYIRRDSLHQVAAFAVHEEHLGTAALGDLPAVSFDRLPADYPPDRYSVFVAVGYTRANRARAEIFEQTAELGYEMPTVVSPRALCWDDLEIGANCFVFDGVVVEPGVVIGDDVVVWSGCQISHDVTVGDHCFLGPNAVVLGDTLLGERVFVGGNATVRNGVVVAEDCVLGAGSVIKRDTRPGEVYSAPATPALEGRDSSELEDL